LTGKRVRSLDAFDVRAFFLSEDRRELYHIIDSRCDEMLTQSTVCQAPMSAVHKGLFGEVTRLLLNQRLDPSTPVAKAIGYRQVISYLCAADYKANDLEALSLFLQNFRTATRNYAKKQITWYRKDNSFLWVQMKRGEEKGDPYERAATEIEHWISVDDNEFSDLVSIQVSSTKFSTHKIIFQTFKK
jgi:tRNA dimethylallyltransferase